VCITVPLKLAVDGLVGRGERFVIADFFAPLPLGDTGRFAQQQFSPQLVPHAQRCEESSTSDADATELSETKVKITAKTAIEPAILRAAGSGFRQQPLCGITRENTRYPRAWFKLREILAVRGHVSKRLVT
jgi:hypothetical protein